MSPVEPGRPRRPAGRLLSGWILALVCAPAGAHDFWIEPATFTPSPGQVVAVRLLVGEHFNGDEVARPPAGGLHRFVLVDAASGAGTTLPGRPGASPAASVRPASPGAYVVAFHGKPNAIVLPADTFNAYLKQEGLESTLALRAQRGQLEQPGREIFSRCAKSLVLVGTVGNEERAVDRELGLPLELIAERQPGRLLDGEPLPIRLLHEGRPLAGALVVALLQSDPDLKISMRSDADGRVFLPLSRAGHWLVKAVHMRPALPGSDAEWESLWASLTFASDAVR